MAPRRLLLLAAAILLLLAPSGAKKKKKKGAAKLPRPKAPAMLSRCSACHAVASDLTERLAPYEGRDVPEVQMLELIEGADNLGHNLGHLCNAMKIRWHHVVTPLTPPRPTPSQPLGAQQLCSALVLADNHGEAGCVHRGGRPGLPPTGRRGAGQVDTHQRGASTPNTVCPARAGIVTVTEGVCAGGEVAAGEERAAGEAEAAG